LKKRMKFLAVAAWTCNGTPVSAAAVQGGDDASCGSG
jgi:hypothetical protein